MNNNDEKLDEITSPISSSSVSGIEGVEDGALSDRSIKEEDGASCYLCTHCGKGYDTEQQLEEHLLKVRNIITSKSNVHRRITNDTDERCDPDTMDDESEPMGDEQIPAQMASGQCEEESLDSMRFNRPSEMACLDSSMTMTSDSPITTDESTHQRQMRAYSCKFCSKLFDSNSALNVHYTHTHRDKPQYECDLCGRVYGVKRELATHRRLHDGQPTHRCRQCGKEFGTKQLLRKHELWHTGERSHVCPQCGKAFFQKGHLTQHMMIHAGGRPHACHLCQKTFIFKFDLNRHMKIHAERVGNNDEGATADSVASLITKSTSYESTGSSDADPAAIGDSNDDHPESTSEMNSPLMDAVFRMASASATPSISTPINAVIQQLHQQHSSGTFNDTLNANAAALGLLRTWTPSSTFLDSLTNGHDHHQRAAVAAAFAQVLARAQQQACLFSGFASSPPPLPQIFYENQRQLQHQQARNHDQNTQEDVMAAGISEHDSTSGSSPETVDDQQESIADASSPPPSCESCREYLQRLEASSKRIQDLEHDLSHCQADVDGLNAKIQRVTDVASRLLESCSDFDKLWMLHSKQVYSQIQNILNLLD